MVQAKFRIEIAFTAVQYVSGLPETYCSKPETYCTAVNFTGNILYCRKCNFKHVVLP